LLDKNPQNFGMYIMWFYEYVLLLNILEVENWFFFVEIFCLSLNYNRWFYVLLTSRVIPGSVNPLDLKAGL